MKKLLNQPSEYVDQSLEGFVLARPELRRVGTRGRVIAQARPAPRDKVGVVSGGGYGHLPLFCGYVGAGLLDACSVGNVFEGPNAESCLEAIKAADGGAGVLKLFGNYGGDRMNFSMAAELAELEGIETTTVLVNDDIASAGPAEAAKRRGVAGTIFAYKIAGAAADAGASLGEVTEMAARAVSRLRTIGLALAPCQVPGASEPTFRLGDDEIELGMGIHGEPGIARFPMAPADEIVDHMMDRLLGEIPTGSQGRVSMLVNGLGATPLEELYILFRHACQRLRTAGFELVTSLVGSYVTSMEMAGASISLFHLDDELERLCRAPASCPFWTVSK